MNQLDKPNFSVALASSYNPRGILGWTNTLTNALDQRKENSLYEVIQNASSSKTTLYLTKRPGTSGSDVVLFGTSGQVAYLVSQGAGLFGNDVTDSWVFSTSGSDSRASSSAATTVILTAASYFPKFVDKTAISGTDNIVVQLFNGSTQDHRVFYSTAISTFTEISDADFTGLSHVGKMEFMDGYAFVGDSATGRIHNSDLNSIANWTATNFITKQIKQDQLRGLAKLGNKIIALGVHTAEVFVNAGNASGSPLATVPELAGDVGIGGTSLAAVTNYYTVLNKRMYFVGRVALGSASLYSFNGQNFEKISRGPFDKILTENFLANTIYSIGTVIFSGKEAIAIQLTNTNATTQRWLMYFPEWNDWFEWNSTVFTPINSGRWFLGVGANQHKLFQIADNLALWQDHGSNFQFMHQFQLPKAGSARKVMRWCGVVGDTARSALSLLVEASDDDGVTWATLGTIDMTSQKKNIYRCGSYQDGRMIRLSYTGALEVRLEKFVARID